MARPANRMRPVHPGEVLREEYLGPLGLSGGPGSGLASCLLRALPGSRPLHRRCLLPLASPPLKPTGTSARLLRHHCRCTAQRALRKLAPDAVRVKPLSHSANAAPTGHCPQRLTMSTSLNRGASGGLAGAYKAI